MASIDALVKKGDILMVDNGVHMVMYRMPEGVLADHIRALMRSFGLTNKECADRLGISQEQFEAWLVHPDSIPITYLVPLAECLGVSVAYLLLPTTDDDYECFPCDANPALRMRQYARIQKDLYFDKDLLEWCRITPPIRFDNEVFDEVMTDLKTIKDGSLNLSYRAQSLFDMSHEHYEALSNLVENLNKHVFGNRQALLIDFDNEDRYDFQFNFPSHRDLCGSEKFLRLQERLSFINSEKEGFSAPSENESWHKLLSYWGLKYDDLDEMPADFDWESDGYFPDEEENIDEVDEDESMFDEEPKFVDYEDDDVPDFLR